MAAIAKKSRKKEDLNLVMDQGGEDLHESIKVKFINS